MSSSLVERIADAVLYEGYILYPYRASAPKNQHRFTFGRVYPEGYSSAQNGAEPCVLQTECLIRCPSGYPQIRVRARFLQPVKREIGKLLKPARTWDTSTEVPYEKVAELRVAGRLYQAWHEARERTIDRKWHLPESIVEERTFEAIDSGLEPINDADGNIVGILHRCERTLSAEISLHCSQAGEQLWKLTLRIRNRTPISDAELNDPKAILLKTFASTHFILEAKSGVFLSLLDPPEGCAVITAQCQNVGMWPVLVGAKEMERDTVLSSPIILYDYPRLAPESPGDLCDGTEIDELLSLRIQTMSDDEKWEMRQVDTFARRILERTEQLTETQFSQMHGRMSRGDSFEEQIFNQTARPQQVCVGDATLRTGDRVRIRPRSRADIMDLALSGKIAVIEAIEQDAEERIHLALIVEDDPGKDLGYLRQPGHRFFFAPDEVEALEGSL